MKHFFIHYFLLFCIILFFSCKKQTAYNDDFVRERLEQEAYGSSNWYAVLDSVITEHPDEAFPYYRKGLQLVRENNYTKGIKLMEHAAELDPYMYANYLGYIKLSSFGDYEAAIGHFKTAIEYDNHVDIIVPGSAYERVAIAYKEMENYEKAISTFNNYIDKFGEDGVDLYTFMYRGIAKTNVGDFESALKDFDTIIRKWEKCPEAYYRKGIIYHKKGDNSLACKQFKKALLYQNYIRGNPSGAYIDQLYVADIEQMFDLTCE